MSSAPSKRGAASLAWRITGWYIGIFVLSLACLAVLAVLAIRDAIAEQEALVAETTVERHVALLATSLPAYRAAVESTAALDEPRVAIRVRDAAGHTLFQHGDLSAALHIATRTTSELRLDLAAKDPTWSAVFERMRPSLWLLVGGALALAFAGGAYMTRRALSPLRDLAATAHHVAVSGDLSRRVPERGSDDELDELSRLMNGMIARNEMLVRGMRDALDHVAHDLRTPMTRLRGTAELALRRDDPAAQHEALADVIEESDQVLAMLRTLMDISEAETGLMRLSRTPTSLTQLARDSVDLYAHVADDAGVALEVEADDADVVAAVDAIRMRQAIANLVDNAVKYTPRGGRVTIAVEAHDARAAVHVRDTGEGIPPEALPRIWDRLYRADPSRTRPGLGLGLSLVKAVVEAHGGTVAVTSELGHGSTFTVEVPR